MPSHQTPTETLFPNGRRVALVTGGGSGLGLATARRFAADGLTVAVADVRAAAAADAAASLAGAGHIGVALDAADEASVHAAFEAVESRLGAIAVLACFAGILSTSREPGRIPLVDMTVEEWDRVNAVNARGMFLWLREMARRRWRQPVAHGRIITISSLAGQQGGVQSGAAYSASKGAVLSLTRLCARELADQAITVNAIAPGPIDTPMMRASFSGASDATHPGLSLIPLGRVGTPEEVAAAAAYLASVDAGFITGATLDVNGGMRMG